MTVAEEMAAKRDQRLSDLLKHRDGCPAVTAPKPGRVESYDVRDPEGQLLKTIRCGECGAHMVTDGTEVTRA